MPRQGSAPSLDRLKLLATVGARSVPRWILWVDAMMLRPDAWAKYEQDKNDLATEDERDAFDDGATDAYLEYEVGACGLPPGQRRTAWLQGHAFYLRHMAA